MFAKYFSSIPPDKAALTALLSYIGVLHILVYAQDYIEIEDNKNDLLNAVTAYHAKIAQYGLDTLQFPEDISRVPSHLNQEFGSKGISLEELIFLSFIHAKSKYDFYTLNEELTQNIHKQIPNLDEVMETEAFNNDLAASMEFYCHQ